jgi:hypothetical protein
LPDNVEWTDGSPAITRTTHASRSTGRKLIRKRVLHFAMMISFCSVMRREIAEAVGVIALMMGRADCNRID